MSKEQKAKQLERRREETNHRPIDECLKAINSRIYAFRHQGLVIEEAQPENISIPEVVLSTDPLTVETFEKLEIKHIPIIVLANLDERQEGPIKISVTNDHPINGFTVTNFDLSNHLPLIDTPISLTTPLKEYRSEYADERYFDFYPIKGRMNPLLPYIVAGGDVHFRDRERDRTITIIVIDARFPTPERDATFFSARVPKEAMEKASGVQFFPN